MDIKTYLFKLKELETSLYEQNALINQLVKMRNSIPKSRGRKNLILETEFTSACPTFGVIIMVIGMIIGVFYGFPKGVREYRGSGLFAILGLGWNAIKTAFLYLLLFGLIGLIAGFIIGLLVDCISKAKIGRENYHIRSENDNIRKYNDNQAATERKEQAVINDEISILNKNYQQTLSTLNKVYDLNIIFPKYRGLVPICSFYEYFCSGRCNSLEGHEGAYNIYENELRQNLIIGKLDVVIDRLDQIEGNQYMLYDAINSTNQRINNISREMKTLSGQIKSISASSRIIEYNTAKSMENTEVLKWLEIHKS